VSRRLVNVTRDNLRDLSPRCRSCVFWELDPVAGERACEAGGTDLEKEAWVSDTLLEWGSCGRIAYVDSAPAGFALFAPPAYVPRSVAFPTSPVSADAVLLMTARVYPDFAGAGLGRMLVQAVVRDVAHRGLKAVEAFGRHGGTDDAADGTDGTDDDRGRRGRHSCVLPADYLLAVGFKTVRPHPKFPRLRLDLKSTVSWKEDVEYALDRLFASITPSPGAVSRT
jgi:GNAT superfamily N-acetyltransferase